MAKNLFTRLSVFVMLTVFLAACSESSDYIHVIPADAATVISIRLETLAEKAGLNDKENEATKQKMLEAMKSEINAATYQQLEKIVNQPNESGIDIEAPFYVFSSSSFPYTSFVGKVNNEENLRTSLNLMAKEELFQPVEEADGFSYSLSKGGLLAFNHSTVMMVNVKRSSQLEKIKEGITALMKQTAENSIVTQGVFQEMIKEDKDLTAFFSLRELPAPYYKHIIASMPAGIKANDLFVTGGLSFEKGKIAVTYHYYTENEETKALLKKHFATTDECNETFIKYFPASTVLFANVNLNGEKFYTMMAENQEFRKTISIAKADAMEQLFKAIKGDITFGILNITLGKSPSFLLYADFKDENMLKQLCENKKDLNLKRGEEIVELSSNEYVFKSKQMNVFYGIKDKKLYATNDEMLYKNINKPADKSITETTYASDMDGKSMFLAVNAEAILDLPVVKLAAGLGGKKLQTALEQANQLSYFAMTFTPNGQGTFELDLKNKDVNALKLIVDAAKQFSGIK